MVRIWRDKELLQKVHNRVEGWKLKCLSREGRLTLAQYVVGSMPIFNMQLERLPGWVHKELDKSTRKCVWGSVEGKKRNHLLDWKCLCKPRELGSAGLKSASEMNQAMMAKLAWRVLNSSGEAWSNVLHSKYVVKDEDGI